MSGSAWRELLVSEGIIRPGASVGYGEPTPEADVERWLAELHPAWRTFTLDEHGRSEGQRISNRALEGIAKGRAARIARES